MKATYNDFLAENLNCSKFASDADAIAIFDILSKNENIIKMVDATEAGKSALSACVNEVEAAFDSISNPTMDLKNEGFTRTVVGRMVKSILAPFGYLPTVQKDMPKILNAKYFTSASCYEKSGPASMRIVRKVEEI